MADCDGSIASLPAALLLDTSFLRTLGGPPGDRYRAFHDYVEANDVPLFLSRQVVEEVEEQEAYIGGDWLDMANRRGWVSALGPVQPGVRVYDGPSAAELMDAAHGRLAELEQEDVDDLRKTDSALAGAAVMILASQPHESVGIVLDDDNAESSLRAALQNTFYEGRIRVLNIWDVIEYVMD